MTHRDSRSDLFEHSEVVFTVAETIGVFPFYPEIFASLSYNEVLAATFHHNFYIMIKIYHKETLFEIFYNLFVNRQISAAFVRVLDNGKLRDFVVVSIP